MLQSLFYLRSTIKSKWITKISYFNSYFLSSLSESQNHYDLSPSPPSSSSSEIDEHSTHFTERLSKYIATTGICSRREAENWIRDGRVQINGKICLNASEKIDVGPNNESNAKDGYSIPLVMVDGVKLVRNQSIAIPKLWAVYKERGELSSDLDPEKKKKLMMERVEQLLRTSNIANRGNKLRSEDLFSLKPINRLDFNTEGLALVTNNIVLQRLLNGHPTLLREYRVRIHGLLTKDKVEGLRRGVFMEGHRQKPMQVVIENTSSTITWLRIQTTEHSNRTVSNSIKQLHLDVTRMISTGFGPYNLNTLASESGIVSLKLTPELMKDFLEYQKKKPWAKDRDYKKVENRKMKD